MLFLGSHLSAHTRKWWILVFALVLLVMPMNEFRFHARLAECAEQKTIIGNERYNREFC